MRNLVHCKADPHDDFVRIIDAKTKQPDKTLLKSMLASVRSRYRIYQKRRYTLEMLERAAYSEEERSALYGCYASDSHDSIPLGALKKRLRDLQPARIRNRCQLCCNMTPTETWDHYIPRAAKTGFPEFGVLSLNLIPACHGCNGRRGSLYAKSVRGRRKREVRARRTINLYFDTVPPSCQLYDVRITEDPQRLGEAVAEFFLLGGARAKTTFGRLFGRHWRALSLAERFAEQFANTYANVAIDVRLAGTTSLEDVAATLSEKAKQRAAMFGANDFEAVVYRAAARAPRVILNGARM
jgi:hypothetical protein